MNMTAEKFLSLYIREPVLPFAKVVVSNAKRGHHYALKPHQPIPDDDDENTIFIRVEQLDVQPEEELVVGVDPAVDGEDQSVYQLVEVDPETEEDADAS